MMAPCCSCRCCCRPAPPGPPRKARRRSTGCRCRRAQPSLDSGLPEWKETTLRLSREWDAARGGRGSGAGPPVRPRGCAVAARTPGRSSTALTASVEAGASPTHRILARHVMGARLQYEFRRPGCCMAGCAPATTTATCTRRSSRWSGTSATSASSRWTPARALGQSTHTVEGRAAWYYGDRSSAGVIVAAGDEATSCPAAVVLAAVRSIALVGRQEVAPDWSLLYGAQPATGRLLQPQRRHPWALGPF